MTTSVPAVTPIPYNIRHSTEGFLLGLDSTQLAAATQGEPLGAYTPYLMGHDLQGLRLFIIGQSGKLGSDYKIAAAPKHVEFFDDFYKTSIDAFWNIISGGNSANVSLQTTLDNGIVQLKSGNSATHTMAATGAQMVGNIQHVPSDGGLRTEFRLGSLAGGTSNSIYFGLCDSSSMTAPFTISGTAVTANATNGAGFVQDSQATGAWAGLQCIAVNAAGTPQVISAGVTLNTTANAYDIARVEIDASGNANYFWDNVQVGSITGAVSVGAPLGPTIGMFAQVTSGSGEVNVDYVYFQKTRTGF